MGSRGLEPLFESKRRTTKSSKRPKRLTSKRKIEKESLTFIQSDDSEPSCKRNKIVQTQTMSTSSSSNDAIQTKSCRVIDLTGDPIVDLTDSPDYENEDLVCLDNSLGGNSANLKKSSDDIKITRTEPPSHKGPSSLLICPVCLEKAAEFQRNGRDIVSTKCGHLFCDLCIRQAIQDNQKCPTCRTKLKMKEFHKIFL